MVQLQIDRLAPIEQSWFSDPQNVFDTAVSIQHQGFTNHQSEWGGVITIDGEVATTDPDTGPWLNLGNVAIGAMGAGENDLILRRHPSGELRVGPPEISPMGLGRVAVSTNLLYMDFSATAITLNMRDGDACFEVEWRYPLLMKVDELAPANALPLLQPLLDAAGKSINELLQIRCLFCVELPPDGSDPPAPELLRYEEGRRPFLSNQDNLSEFADRIRIRDIERIGDAIDPRKLPFLDANLEELLGISNPFEFLLSEVEDWGHWMREQTLADFVAIFDLAIGFGGSTQFSVRLAVPFDLLRGRLRENRIYFTVLPGETLATGKIADRITEVEIESTTELEAPPDGKHASLIIEGHDASYPVRVIDGKRVGLDPTIGLPASIKPGASFMIVSGESNVMDLDYFALHLPGVRSPYDPIDLKNHDGYLDLSRRELVLDFAREEPADEPQPPAVSFPGGFTDPANEGLLEEELRRRFRMRLEKMKSEDLPELNADRDLFLRINGDGITFHATLLVTEVEVLPDRAELISGVKLEPLAEQGGVPSQLRVLDNRIDAAVLGAKVFLPGLQGLVAEVQAGLRQQQSGQAPLVYATIQLERANEAPLAQLQLPLLQFQLDDVRLALSWDGPSGRWDMSADADGALSFTDADQLVSDLQQLRDPGAIQVRGLDLMRLNLKDFSIELGLDEPVRFGILDGLFEVELHDLKMTWSGPLLRRLSCRWARFTYQDPGTLKVSVTAGGLELRWERNQLRVRFPLKLGFGAKLGPAVDMTGEVGWVETARERFLLVNGSIELKQLPRITGLMKIGVGTKANGQVVPNIVIYGAQDVDDVELFAGLVAKQLGAGIGSNNRLSGIDARPRAEQLLARIDQLAPGVPDNWAFVERDGFFVSIVATALLASNRGAPSTINAYVASLVLNFDTDLNVVAAGKLWLASSVDFARANWQRPAVVGAVSMSVRDLSLSAALESRQNAAIEANSLLEKILAKGRVRMAFRLAPDLVDYHLQEVSYADTLLGFAVQARGSFRVAIFRRAVLVKAGLLVTGAYHKALRGGSGGMELTGGLRFDIGYGGLLTARGMAAYGGVDASVQFRASAWIEIVFRITIKLFGKRWSESWSVTFSLSVPNLEVRIRGQVAFDESGTVGFAGAIGVSVNICGYPLSIDASLKHQPEVYDNVKGRVAAFERALNQRLGARELLPTRPFGRPPPNDRDNTRARAALTGADWLVYRAPGEPGTEPYQLLIPSRGAQWRPSDLTRWWFTPTFNESAGADDPLFPAAVEYIEVLDDRDAVTHTLYMPFDRAQWQRFELDRTQRQRLNEIQAMFLETALPQGSALAGQQELRVDQPSDLRLYVDPRVRSESRAFWKLRDLALLPDFAWPIEFRTLAEVLGAADSELPQPDGPILTEVADYEYIRARAARRARHLTGDRDDNQLADTARSRLIGMLLEDLRNPGGPRLFGPVAENDDDVLGLMYRSSTSPAELRIKLRGHDIPVAVTVAAPDVEADDAGTKLADLIELPPIRQTFLPSEADPDGRGGNGKVVVKLPWVPFSDPEGEYHDFLNRLDQFGHLQIFRQLPGEPTPRMIADGVRPNLEAVTLPPQDDGMGGSVTETVLLLDPYVFTDTFDVENLRFSSADLTPGHSEVRYSVRYARNSDFHGAAGDPAESGRSAAWPGVRLFIPPPDEFPRDLVAIFTVPALRLPQAASDDGIGDIAFGEFHLASLQDTKANPPRVGARPLSVDDIEIWSREVPIDQSGFYGAPDADPTLGVPKDNSSLMLDQVENEPRLFSTDGKLRLGLTLVERRGRHFRLSAGNGGIRAGYGYELYYRAAGSPELLTRLPGFLTREFPAALGVELPLQPVAVIEPIDAGEYRRAGGSDGPEPLPATEFSDRRRQAPQENRIQLQWPAGRSGGVELQVVDSDDPTLVDRRLCEVLSKPALSKRHRDFSAPSLWSLHHGQCIGRVARRLPPDKTVLGANESQITDAFVVSSTANNGLLSELTDAADRFNPADDWRARFEALAGQWYPALYRFQKSPLNLGGEIEEKAVQAMFALTRLLFSGLKIDLPALPEPDPNVELDNPRHPGMVLAAAAALLDRVLPHEKALHARLAAQDNASDAAAARDEQTRQQAVDRSIAPRLAAIVQRRLAIADDCLSGATFDDLPDSAGANPEQPYPRDERWHAILRERPSEPGETFPDTDWFATNFFDDETNPTVANLSNLLRAYAAFQSGTGRADQSRVVPHAAGLIALLERAEDAGPPWTLLKRPHHTLSTETDDNGRLTGKASAVEDFLPDRDRAGALNGVRGSEPLDLLAGDEPLVAVLGRRRSLSLDETMLHGEATGEMLHGEATGERTPLQFFGDYTPSSTIVDAHGMNQGDRALVLMRRTDQRTTLWDAREGRLLRDFSGDDDSATAAYLASTDIGPRVVTAHAGRSGVTLKLRDPRLEVLDEPPPEPVVFAPLRVDGAELTESLQEVRYARHGRLLLGSVTNAAQLWQDNGNQQAAEQEGAPPVPLLDWVATLDHPSRGGAPLIAFAHDAERDFAITAGATTARVWDLRRDDREFDNGRLIRPAPEVRVELGGGPGDATALAFEPHRGLIAVAFARSGTDPAQVRIWNLHGTLTPQRTHTATDTGTDFKSVGFIYSTAINRASQGIELVIGDSSGALTLIDLDPDGESEPRVLRGIPEGHSGGIDKLVTLAVPPVRSRLASGVASLFNLLERVGFAVDVAAVDQQNQPQTLDALRTRFRQLRTPGHCFALASGLDLESSVEDSATLGFSFVKVAVVPEAFQLALSEETPVVARGKVTGVEGRTLTVEVDGSPTISGNPSLMAEGLGAPLTVSDHELNEPDTPFTRGTINIAETDALPAVNARFVVINPADRNRFERVRPWFDRRRLMFADALSEVDSLNSLCRLMQYTLPWVDQTQERSPIEVALQLKDNSQVIAANRGGTASLTWTEVDAKGHRPRFGLRQVSRFEPLLQWAGLANSDHSLDQQDATLWREQTVPPLLATPAESPALPLAVASYPDAELIRFSYQLPPPAARSLYNQISAVRTGSKGVDLSFRFELIDRTERPMDDLLRVIEIPTGAGDGPRSRRRESLPHAKPAPARLFRHERLISLDEHPFFYRYRLDVRALRQVRTPPTLAHAAHHVRSGRSLTRFVERRPTCLTSFRPHLRRTEVGDDKFRYHLKLYVPSFDDQLSDRERCLMGTSLAIRARFVGNAANGGPLPIGENHLPDLGLAFHLLWEAPGSSDPTEPAFLAVADLVLPWHSLHPQLAAESEVNRPIARLLNSDVALVINNTPSEDPITNLTLRYHPNDGPNDGSGHYDLELVFEVQKGTEFFQEPDRFLVQTARDGYRSLPTYVQTEGEQ